MKRSILILISALLISCEAPHANRVPHIGQQFENDYSRSELVEETTEFVKYRVTGIFRDYACTYYVTCDHNGKIIAVYKN